MSGGDTGQISPDGQWYWDGQRWQSTLSPDGRWRWDGHRWIAAVAAISGRPRSNALGSTVGRIPGFRTHTGWKVAAVAFGLLATLAAVQNLPSGGGPQTASRQQRGAAGQDTPQAPALSQSAHSPSPMVFTQPSPSPSSRPTPTPTPAPTATPTPTPTPAPPPAPPPPQNLCGAPSNPWGYNFCGGALIYSPPANFCSYFNCIPSFWKSTNGYVDQCNDGTYSHSGGRQGACSYHGGEQRPLYAP